MGNPALLRATKAYSGKRKGSFTRGRRTAAITCDPARLPLRLKQRPKENEGTS